MQGRLTNFKLNKLAVYPKYPYTEIKAAKNLNLSHIEFITEENFNPKNLIWSDKKIKKFSNSLKKNNLKKISFIEREVTRPRALSVAQYVQRPRHPEEIGRIAASGDSSFSGLQPPLPIKSPKPSISPGETKGAFGNLEPNILASAVAIQPLTITFFP